MESNKIKIKITDEVEELENRLELGGWLGGNEGEEDFCCGDEPEPGIDLPPIDPKPNE